jgi:hypothetical protein
LQVCSVLGVACALTAALEAADGVLVVSKMTTGTTTRTSQIQIERNRMRAEMNDPSGGRQIVIFDGTKQVMYIIDTDKKTYTELTQTDVTRLGSQMSDAMAQMNSALASLPPSMRPDGSDDGRARHTSGMAPAKTVFKKTGTDKVGRWTCDKYEGYQAALKRPNSHRGPDRPGILDCDSMSRARCRVLLG